MKKIALIMDGWKRYFTSAWPAGILQRIRETDEEVNLYIFNSSGDWSWDSNYNVGEYNIYKLPNLKDFDGIIVDVNNIRYPDVVDELAEAVRKTGKPAISIANEIPGFYYVGIDNYKAITGMAEHLYDVHGCRKYWFIMGPRENYENSVRAKALRDFMKRHDLECKQDDFYFESYEYICGYKGFMRMLGKLKEDESLPDAIMCANDNIAVGVLEAAAESGYKVPDDFRVTGFDNFDKASFYSPKITTVSHIREDVGYKCADILIRMWKGEKIDRFNFTDTEYICWDSCGCKSDAQVDYVGHTRGQILYDIETTEFEEQVLELDYKLLTCKSVREISACIPECIPAFNCDAIYLVLDEHMNDFKKHRGYYSQKLIDDEKFHTKGYPKDMYVEFAYDRKNGNIKEDYNVDNIFPLFDVPEKGTDFLFMPLHFRNRTVGYFAIRNAIYLMEKQYLFRVLNVLTSAMENLYEKEKLEYMNRILMESSIHDAMTGMYNRLAFPKLVADYYREKKAIKESILIMFIDMDRLKYINDTFGHEYGDMAIKTISAVILRNCDESAIAIRNGGDEFVVIQDSLTIEAYNNLVKRMRFELIADSQRQHFPFEVSFSIGAVWTDMYSDHSVDYYISRADKIMYEEKLLKKANRTE
jgi:diguanylate cyclase (GGDEF)-like protein